MMKKQILLLALLLSTSVILAQKHTHFFPEGASLKNILRTPVAAPHHTPKNPGSTVLLDFEGITGWYATVGDYYNGAGGTNYGVSFNAQTLALSDAIGIFTNEPSPTTIISDFFLSDHIIMNVAGGFNTSLSFYHAAWTAWTVNIYDGPDGTGNLLATYGGNQNNFGICSDTFLTCVWAPVTVPFAGIARSAKFSGDNALDNISIHTGDAPAGVPTLGQWGLILLGGILVMVGSVYLMRRNHATNC